MSRLSIGEPLVLRTLQDAFGAHVIGHAKLRAIVGPEIELGQIAVNVLFANVLIGLDQTSLEHGKDAFRRVRMHLVRLALTHIGLVVVNGFMVRHRGGRGSRSRPFSGSPKRVDENYLQSDGEANHGAYQAGRADMQSDPFVVAMSNRETERKRRADKKHIEKNENCVPHSKPSPRFLFQYCHVRDCLELAPVPQGKESPKGSAIPSPT